MPRDDDDVAAGRPAESPSRPGPPPPRVSAAFYRAPRVDPSRPARVAVVEDEAGLREALGEFLRAAGFDVVGEAETGAAGLDVISEARPDVALVDYRMPGMDGVELCRAVKERSPGTRVVVLTAFDEPALARDAGSAGADGFLVKGCDPETVASTLRDVLRRPPSRPR